MGLQVGRHSHTKSNFIRIDYIFKTLHSEMGYHILTSLFHILVSCSSMAEKLSRLLIFLVANLSISFNG